MSATPADAALSERVSSGVRDRAVRGKPARAALAACLALSIGSREAPLSSACSTASQVDSRLQATVEQPHFGGAATLWWSSHTLVEQPHFDQHQYDGCSNAMLDDFWQATVQLHCDSQIQMRTRLEVV